MNKTPIEWTTFSANPLKYRDAAGNVVWGCVHASPGCQHCYSETLAKRYGRGGPFNVQTMNTLTPFLDEAELHKMRTAKTIGGVTVAGSRCFIGDMTDIFGEWVSDDLLNRLFSQTLEIRTDVTWQILTKRAARMRDYLSWRWGEGRIPSRHIHIGVSCENQHFADERIPLLLATPAGVRFISAEPLLGPVNLKDAIERGLWDVCNSGKIPPKPAIDWVIVGGESGSGARPFDLAWARLIVQQCQAAAVPCFVKQLGAHVRGPLKGCLVDWFEMPDGEWRQLPIIVTPSAQPWVADTRTRAIGARLFNKKGGDPSEWPEDLRIRQFPEARA
jgi:protein gp37